MQKVIQFKQLEKNKLIEERRRHYEEQRELLIREQKTELDMFNSDQDQKMKDKENEWSEIFEAFQAQQDEEVKIKADEFENKYPKAVKSNPESLNLAKTLETAIKQKE
jgi:hypothetical protein